MAKSNWIVQRSDDEQLLAATAERKGKIFRCSAVRTLENPEQLEGTVHLSLESRRATVLVDEFPDVKDDILKLQIVNNLDKLAYFNLGEGVSTAYSVLEERRQKKLLTIF